MKTQNQIKVDMSADDIKNAIGLYVSDVKSKDFPNEKEQY